MNFLLSILLLTADASFENLEHLRLAKWKVVTPQVVICNGLTIKTEVVQKAVNYWRFRGEKIGSIRRKSCADEPLRGEIAIYRGDQLPEDHAGATLRFIKNEDIAPQIEEITRASIQIREQYTDSEILLQHEIGHALGFADTDDENSIMSGRGPLY